MVNGEAFDDAVELARKNQNLSVGIHLVLVQGISTVNPVEIPDLVDHDGYFPNNAVLAGLKIFFLQITKETDRERIRCSDTKVCIN